MGGINCRRITVGRNASELQTESLRLNYASFLESVFQYNGAFNLGNADIEKVMAYEKSNEEKAYNALTQAMDRFKLSMNFLDNSISQLKTMLSALENISLKEEKYSKEKSSYVLEILNTLLAELEKQEEKVDRLVEQYEELNSVEFIEKGKLNEVIRDTQITDLTENIFSAMSKTLSLVCEFSTLIKVEDRTLVISKVSV